MQTISEILGDVVMVADPSGPRDSVSRDSLSRADAMRLQDELLAAGYRASWAPDNDDHTRAWLYLVED